MNPRRSGRRALVAAGALLVALLAGAAPVRAAAPWVTVVSGGPLDGPVVIRGWDVNHALGLSLGPLFRPDPEHLVQRPSLLLALYAGPDWAWLASDDAVPRLDEATYYGRFFPAVGRRPAIMQIYETGELLAPVARTTLTFRGARVEVATSRQARLVGPEGLAILERHGVATRVDPAAVDRAVLVALGALVATLMVVARALARPRPRRSPRSSVPAG